MSPSVNMLTYVLARLGDWQDKDGDIWTINQNANDTFTYGWKRLGGQTPTASHIESDLAQAYNVLTSYVVDEWTHIGNVQLAVNPAAQSFIDWLENK